jgi:hypothetical protein
MGPDIAGRIVKIINHPHIYILWYRSVTDLMLTRVEISTQEHASRSGLQVIDNTCEDGER